MTHNADATAPERVDEGVLSSNRIDLARLRLERAFARLESAAQAALARANPVEEGPLVLTSIEEFQAVKDELARVKSENETLEELLEESEETRASLQKAVEAISPRLDAAIAKVERALGTEEG